MPSSRQSFKAPTPRRKACNSCASSKVRCDHKSPCTRCQQRGETCLYPGAQAAADQASLRVNQRGVDQEVQYAETQLLYALTTNPLTSNPSPTPLSQTAGQFQTIDASVVGVAEGSGAVAAQKDGLVCNINAAKIQSRWLRSFVAEPGDQAKDLPSGVTSYMFRILKSYCSSVINGSSVPPFIHQLQLEGSTASQPLTDCLRLLRICDHRLPGSQSLAIELIEREMQKLLSEYTSYSDSTLLSAFQAYLLYTMTLFFEFDRLDHPDFQHAALSLQSLASATAQHGIAAAAELRQSQPDWDVWITAEAKRRTLYTFYLFDNLLCMKSHLPVFLGTELRGMLAPAKAALWRAGSRDEWQSAYNAYLARSQAPGFAIDELWKLPDDTTKAQKTKNHRRIDAWLEGLDEFGAMLYAVTVCTHGD